MRRLQIIITCITCTSNYQMSHCILYVTSVRHSQQTAAKFFHNYTAQLLRVKPLTLNAVKCTLRSTVQTCTPLLHS